MNRLVIDALGWTLVHFLWQGALIAAALCVADLALAKSRAAARYLAACLAFGLMLAAPAGTFLTLRSAAKTPAPARTFVATKVSSIAVSQQPSIADLHLPAPLAGSAASVLRSRPSFSRLLPWVVGVWILGVVALSLRLIGGWWLVRRLVRSSGNVSLEAWQARLADLAERMRVSRPVRLCRSALVEVPTVIGWLRPMILLPASTLSGLSPAQIEAILAHELAHIRRHDYLVNLLQSVVEMLLFYHPAVWWVSKRIRDERELCCDDLAIRISGDPVSYARALYELERLRGETFDLALAASGGSLPARIARLLGLPGRPRDVVTRGLVGLIGAMAVIALLAVTGLEQSAVLANASSKIARTVERVSARVAAPVLVKIAAGPRATTVVVTEVEPAPEADAAPYVEPAPDADAAPEAAAAPVATPAELATITVETQACSSPVAVAAIAMATTVTRAVAACTKPEDSESAGNPAVTGRLTAAEWEAMRQHGVSERYVAALDQNLPELTSDEIITLANHGVSSLYVANLKRAGLEQLSVDDLVRLASHGVNSTYVANLKQAGLDHVSVDDLVQLADHGVSSAYVRGLKGVDPNDFSVDQLIRLASSGVSSEWYSAMDWMGLSKFSVEEAIQLRNAGITAEYANKLKLVTHRHLTLEELRRLANQGVTSDYAARMYVLFGANLDVDKLLQLRNQGVSSEYAEQMMVAAGPISIEDLIALRNQGIEPGYAYEMSVLGRLETRDLIRLHQSGVSADFVEQAKKQGYDHPSVSELIRLYQRGLPARTED